MDTSRRRFIRLAMVTATAAGVALASPVVAVADDSEVVETATTGESYDPPVVTTLTTEPVIIELVIEGVPPPIRSSRPTVTGPRIRPNRHDAGGNGYRAHQYGAGPDDRGPRDGQ